MSRRRIAQIIAAVVLNPFVPNFIRGRLYGGGIKAVCVPALNCYSCPAAVGACPLGSMQVMLSSLKGYLGGKLASSAAWAAAYVVGAVAVVGAIGGRLACGWICPFGLAQELLLVRRNRPTPLPRWPLLIKYAFLAVFVIALPLLLAYPSSPMFCKLICPAGTSEAGIPLMAHDRLAGDAVYPVGLLFAWKLLLMLGFLAGTLVVSRFFCRTACPLGAAWGLFNRTSLVALEVDRGECTRCGFCKAICPMDIEIFEDAGSAECIRCFRCADCPHGAVRVVVRGLTSGRGAEAEQEGVDSGT